MWLCWQVPGAEGKLLPLPVGAIRGHSPVQPLLQHPGPEDSGASQTQGLQEPLHRQEINPVQPPASEEGDGESPGHPKGYCEPQELPESSGSRGRPSSLQTQVWRGQWVWLPAVVGAAAVGTPTLPTSPSSRRAACDHVLWLLSSLCSCPGSSRLCCVVCASASHSTGFAAGPAQLRALRLPPMGPLSLTSLQKLRGAVHAAAPGLAFHSFHLACLNWCIQDVGRQTSSLGLCLCCAPFLAVLR